MFMLTSTHRRQINNLHNAEEHRRRINKGLEDSRFNELLRSANSTLLRTDGERLALMKKVERLEEQLRCSQECSDIQANIIRGNNKRMESQEGVIRAQADRLNAAQSSRKCAMEERIFQQLGALLAEKPVDLAAENAALKTRIKRARAVMAYSGGYEMAMDILAGSR